MVPSPARWQLTLARIEGALPFVSPRLAEGLALASLRRLWRIHVRDYTFDNIGIEHDPGIEADELVRSWYSEERRQFLSWITRRAPPPLAQAAQLVLTAKNQTEGFSETYLPADRALARLDQLLPSSDPMEALREWLEQLRTQEVEFLEGGSEVVEFGGVAISRPALRGSAWAASLAVAMRPQLFGLGSAPLAFAGIMPRALFRELPEEPLPALLGAALEAASARAETDLHAMLNAECLANERLSHLYASSTAPQALLIIVALGPLTRAELARGLGVTKRTASQSVAALEAEGMLHLRPSDGAIIAASVDRALYE
jgi:DNA-binding transcriptional ArsR family regulator